MKCARVSEAVRKTYGGFRAWLIEGSVDRKIDDEQNFSLIPGGELVRTLRGVAFVKGDGLIEAWGRMSDRIDQYAALAANDRTYVMYLDKPADKFGDHSFYVCNAGLLVISPQFGTITQRDLTEVTYRNGVLAPRVKAEAIFNDKPDSLILEEYLAVTGDRVWDVHLLDLERGRLKKHKGCRRRDGNLNIYAKP